MLAYRCFFRPLLLAFVVVGFTGMSQALAAPMVGLTVTSYTINGTGFTAETPTSLAFQSSSNPSFSPSEQNELVTGDAAVGTDWRLGSAGLYFAGFGNLVGIQATSTLSQPVAITGQLSGTWNLSLTDTLTNAGPFMQAGFSNVAITLTPSGGSAVDLMNAGNVGVTFTPGTYTLAISGDVTGQSQPAIAAVFTPPVPEPTTLGLATLGLVGAAFAHRFRRRRTQQPTDISAC